MITINIRDALVKIREAFDNKTLQMFNYEQNIELRYSGPCAIGVCVSPSERTYLDAKAREIMAYSLSDLIDNKIVNTPNNRESVALTQFQEMHDDVCTGTASIEDFEDLLVHMERAYPTVAEAPRQLVVD